MNIIEAERVSKVYEGGTRALDRVSFSVAKGEFVAVVGPSGSGKSTLLHILGFLDRQSEGEYRFEGKKMSDYSEDELARVRNRKMGFVFQQFNLLPRTTVLENVMLPLLYDDSVEPARREELARKAIEDVGLGHRMHHESSRLSGGEKQRAAIARALVNDPDIIFADEPTGNLDSKSGEVVMGLIEDLGKRGHTIILITHESYTAAYAERVLTLFDGRIVSDERLTARNRTGRKGRAFQK